MAIRLLQSEVPRFIAQQLLNIRAGLEAAFEEGIVVEMPEKLDFSLDVVIDGSTRTQSTVSQSNETGSSNESSQSHSSNQETASSSSSGSSSGSSNRSSSGSESSSSSDTSTTISSNHYAQYINN